MLTHTHTHRSKHIHTGPLHLQPFSSCWQLGCTDGSALLAELSVGAHQALVGVCVCVGMHALLSCLLTCVFTFRCVCVCVCQYLVLIFGSLGHVQYFVSVKCMSLRTFIMNRGQKWSTCVCVWVCVSSRCLGGLWSLAPCDVVQPQRDLPLLLLSRVELMLMLTKCLWPNWPNPCAPPVLF